MKRIITSRKPKRSPTKPVKIVETQVKSEKAIGSLSSVTNTLKNVLNTPIHSKTDIKQLKALEDSISASIMLDTMVSCFFQMYKNNTRDFELLIGSELKEKYKWDGSRHDYVVEFLEEMFSDFAEKNINLGLVVMAYLILYTYTIKNVKRLLMFLMCLNILDLIWIKSGSYES